MWIVNPIPFKSQICISKAYFLQTNVDLKMQFMKAWWLIYAPMDWVLIGSDNGLSPVQYLCWNLPTEPLENKAIMRDLIAVTSLVISCPNWIQIVNFLDSAI